MTKLTDWQRGYRAGAREAHLIRDANDASASIRTYRVYLIGYPIAAVVMMAVGQPWWIATLLAIPAVAVAFPYWAAVKRLRKARAELRYLSRYATSYHKGIQ